VPDGWAYLDWVTGIVRINCGKDEYLGLKAKTEVDFQQGRVSSEQQRLLETVTHEVTHYFQVCTTGYLHRLVRELTNALLDTLPEVMDVDQLPEEALMAAGRRLNEIKQRLTVAGPRNLTILDLIEGAAFLIQKRYHFPKLTGLGYADLLI